ncbi:NADPH-dependent F420 reductase [Microbacterium binotii]|uniref:NAD(P)-binding domain-containing protein n=1 Tax=Microbacterium binotii TaxID=462710 RepID=A0ABN3P883_9MICO
MTRVGIIGAGHIGSALAKGLVERGYEVAIANSRGPETLADLVSELGPKAHAATAADAAAFGEWAIVTVPLKAIDQVPVAELAGKIVVDTNNYYWERDGRIQALEDKQTTTSEMLQERLPASTVVKGFNHIMAAQINTDGTPAGTENRRALATAADTDEGLAFITALYDEFGYDTVAVGALSESWRIERDQPAYVVRQNVDELRANLARATR